MGRKSRKLLFAGVVVLVISILAFRYFSGRERTFVAGKLSRLPIEFTRLVGRYEWIDTNTIFFVRHHRGGLAPSFSNVASKRPPTETNFVSILFKESTNRMGKSEYAFSWKFLPRNSSLVVGAFSFETNTTYLVNLTNKTHRTLRPAPFGDLFESPSGEIFDVERVKGEYLIRNSSNQLLKIVETTTRTYPWNVGFDYRGRFVIADVQWEPTKIKLLSYPIAEETPVISEYDFLGCDSFEFELSADGTKLAVTSTAKRKFFPKTTAIWIIDLKSATKTLVYETTQKRGPWVVRFAPHGISFMADGSLYVISPSAE